MIEIGSENNSFIPDMNSNQIFFTSDSTNVKLDQPKAFILSDFPIGLYNGVDTVIINWDEFTG